MRNVRRHHDLASGRAVRRPWAEDGSFVLALLAVLVIGGLVAALFVRTVSSQSAARFDRDFQEVVHHADAGVQQALYMLEADVEAETDADPIAKRFSEWEQGDSGTFVLDVDGNEINWTIERVDSRTWEVTSTSDLNGTDRTVVATVQERRTFFASAFAHLLAEFNNQNYADTYKSNDVASPYGEDHKYWPRPGRLGIVGSNTEVEFGGNSSTVDGVQLWNFGEDDTVADRCTGAGQTDIGMTSSDATGLSDPDYDPPDLDACEPDAFVRPEDSLLGPYSSTFSQQREFIPSNDELRQFLQEGAEGDPDSCGPRPYPDFDNGTSGTGPTTLEPVTSDNASTLEPDDRFDVGARDLDGDSEFHGPGERFYCFNNMTFGQNTSLDPSATGDADDDGQVDHPVVIYATGSVDVKGPGAGTQRLVNCDHCTDSPTYGTDTISKPPPIASALQLYLVEVGGNVPEFQMDSHSKFGGTIYGPHSTCGNSGSAQAEVYGSMICDTINNVGGWRFHYDDALTLLGNGDFEVGTWREETD